MPMKELFFPILLEQEMTAADGTRLAAPLSVEHAASLRGRPDGTCIAPLYLVGECVSTFDVVWELCRTRAMPPWSGVLAVSQTRGRGQLRREWISPPGNLYVSFFLPPDMEGLGTMAPLATGFCVHRALLAMDIPTRLKWPNDIVLYGGGQEGKFGGLLLEEREGRLLAGLGLNMRSAPREQDLRRDRAIPAASLAGFNGSVLDFWRTLVERIRDIHTREIAGASREELRQRIENALAWRGRNVHVEDEGITGIVSGLDSDGSLLLRTDTGLVAVTSGSVRPCL